MNNDPQTWPDERLISAINRNTRFIKMYTDEVIRVEKHIGQLKEAKMYYEIIVESRKKMHPDAEDTTVLVQSEKLLPPE